MVLCSVQEGGDIVMVPPYHIQMLKHSGLSGELYSPADFAKKGAALIIMCSSAGVCDIRERFMPFFSHPGGIPLWWWTALDRVASKKH
jgi:hypothetical protein